MSNFQVEGEVTIIYNFIPTPGAAGLFGCLAVCAGNLAGILIYEHHDWVSDTISDLAAGPYGWIQDSGMILFALGILGCAIGLRLWWRGPRVWRAAAAVLVVLAVDVVVIAAHNEYGDRDSGKYVIHRYAVYLLALLFLAAAVLSGMALRRLGDRLWSRASLAIGLLWLVLAPIFLVVPTGWDGAYERFLGLLMIAWFSGASLLLLRRQDLA